MNVARVRKKTKGRDVTGILILDKHTGISSNLALQKIKTLLNIAKIGHAGSLDPLATGVLPLLMGKATKAFDVLMEAKKTYLAQISFGQRTDSGDADGQIISQGSTTGLTEANIEEALVHFRGDIEQIPPMYSALKHKGQRLYKLARQGIEVERVPRPITIFRNELKSFNNNQCELNICCSKGSYIRTIADDLGEMLGCGAHIKGLRRLAVGDFAVENAWTIDFIEKKTRSEGIDSLDELILPVSSLAGFDSL